MTPAERYRAIMEMKPADRLPRYEFGFMEGTLDLWKKQGMNGCDKNEFFTFDADIGRVDIRHLGWCEPAFFPMYEDILLRTEGDYDIVRDTSGRTVRFFKGRRNNFMPSYLKHAVSNREDWENEVRPRLSPDIPERLEAYDRDVEQVTEAVKLKGSWLQQRIIGAYMYLRALMGPEDIMYAFYDTPDLVNEMLAAWVELADRLTARLQTKIQLDEVFFGEDICYKNGLLISPDTWREFLKPRYLDLIGRVQARQSKQMMIQIDTDGRVDQAIPLYTEIGMDIMSPFEAAAGNDLVQIAREYPNLRMIGGIDKMAIARGKEAIDSHLESIIPFMRERGGYIPTFDHGVPNEVSLNDYLYYRKRVVELGG